MDLAGITFSDFAIKVLPAKTAKCNFVCLLNFPEHSDLENTLGYTIANDLGNTLGYAFFKRTI